MIVSAAREVAHSPESVYRFLSCLENHVHLDGHHLAVARLDADRAGGRIFITGPLGARRTAQTRVTVTQEPHRFGGVACVGRTTRADVQWRIEPTRHGALVILELEIRRIGVADRVLFAFGGRLWLRRAFDGILAALAHTLDSRHARASYQGI